MAAKVGPSTVSYGIGVRNRYSAFLDDDDGFATPASIMEHSKRIAAELNKQHQKALVASKPNNQSSYNNNPSGGPKSGTKVASSKQHAPSEHSIKGAQQSDSRRIVARRGQQPNQQQSGHSANLGANDSVHSASRQQQQNGGNFNKYQGHNGVSTNGANNKFSRTPQSNGFSRMTNSNTRQHSFGQAPSHAHNSMNKENNGEVDGSQQQGARFPRQNNQRPIVKRSFNNNLDDQRKGGQLPHEDGIGSAIGQSVEEEKRRRQQKRALDMKHKDPEKREAKRQQSNQAAQSADGSNAAADLVSSPGNQGAKPGGRRGPRQFQDVEKNSDEAGRAQRGGVGTGGFRNRVRRAEGDTGTSGDRRENVNRAPRGDRPQRNRNGFGQGSRGSRGDDQGNFSSMKQRPIPNFSDKSDFPSLAS